MITITIRKLDETDALALYEHYQGQNSPQLAFLQIDCENQTLRAGVDYEIGNAVPVAVWHHRTIRYYFGAGRTPTAASANALLDEIAPLAQRVVEGYKSRWDGRNHIGHLTDDAQEADSEIERVVGRAGEDDDSRQLVVWDAGEWLGGAGPLGAQAGEFGISAITSDEVLGEIEDRLSAEAREEGIHYLRDLADHLESIRRWCRERCEEIALEEEEEEVE